MRWRSPDFANNSIAAPTTKFRSISSAQTGWKCVLAIFGSKMDPGLRRGDGKETYCIARIFRTSSAVIDEAFVPNRAVT
jgi:hypothetical protein